jgi:hypothetical protein
MPSLPHVHAEFGDFKLSLDPDSLDSDSAAKAREALQRALAALERQEDAGS